MNSRGQEWALSQLHELVKASGGAFELFESTDANEPSEDLVTVVTIDCSGFAYQEGGVRFKSRERIRLQIPAYFPVEIPRAYFTHDRYAECPHVQWGDYVCLYQAPDVEWHASRGMFGLIQRLHEWLKAAAAGTLDPVGMPLHPPVAYSSGQFFIVPRENAPSPSPPFWSGYVEITREDKVVAELGRWIEHSETRPKARLASAVLLPGSMPHEYPTSIAALLATLMSRGIPLELLRLIIEIGVLSTPANNRALFVLGAAMRGVAGEQRLQHLACWRIDADVTNKLRDAILAATDNSPIDEKAFYDWALQAKVEWCTVFEDRPEIVERRDSQAPASWWRGKTVALLGCGAIGSAVAMTLARAGVSRLHLIDRGIITPGILVRQGFPRNHIGYTKVSSLKLAVQDADPNVEVTTDVGNLTKAFGVEDRRMEILSADVILDATASGSVSATIEEYFREQHEAHPPIVSMVVGHRCDFGMMTLAPRDSVGMSFQLDRQAKLAFANSGRRQRFLEEFWPKDPGRRVLFQPEPGCSSPTFRGSHADVVGLTARMVNMASKWLASAEAIPQVFAIDLSGDNAADGSPCETEIDLLRPIAFLDGLHGYEVRLSEDALKSMLAWTRRAERIHKDQTETGGVLFGQIDEFLRIAWIDEASGPPPDSLASPEGFVCGTAGLEAMNEEKITRSTGSVAFVGMWHTHPEGLPIPSITDLRAMRDLLKEGGDYQGRNFLMLIIGGTATHPIFLARLYERADYVSA